MVCKPSVSGVCPQSLGWEPRFVPATTAVAVNRDLLSKRPVWPDCCPMERGRSPRADAYFQTQVVMHLQERWAMAKVSCSGIQMENCYMDRESQRGYFNERSLFDVRSLGS